MMTNEQKSTNVPSQPQPQPHPEPVTRHQGFLNARKVRATAFFVITLCIIVSVMASILAIWNFAQPDVLWRTVATCAVIATGFVIFAKMNTSISSSGED